MTKHFRIGEVTPEPLDFEDLQRMADDDPVALLDRCRKRSRAIKQGTRVVNWHQWVACYAGALGIRKHPERFENRSSMSSSRSELMRPTSKTCCGSPCLSARTLT